MAQLVFIDEHFALDQPIIESAVFLSNRYDVVQRLKQAGLKAYFSDFDPAVLPEQDYQTIYYRISKEKAVVHHLINTACKLLPEGGELMLLGHKKEGIKTYLQKASVLLGSKAKISRQGELYQGQIIKQQLTGNLLDAQDYPQLRSIGSQNDIEFLSKPGIFGWNKIDAGSALVIEQLPHYLDSAQSLLDLGCGYGYLALMACSLKPFERVVATDNNAAAIHACHANFAAQKLSTEVIADDCGQSLIERFDLILCNPAFHRGFSHDQNLTERFLAATQRLLKPAGQALFVVNQFIALERLAAQTQLIAELVMANRSYKVLCLTRVTQL